MPKHERRKREMSMTKKQRELKRERDRRYREKKRLAAKKAAKSEGVKTTKPIKPVASKGLKVRIQLKKPKAVKIDPVQTRCRVAAVALKALSAYLMG